MASIASLPTVSLPVDTSTTSAAQSVPMASILDVPWTNSTMSQPLSGPIVLSPSFPPIPQKLVTKIQSGAFVAMKELLGDNIALMQRVEEMQGLQQQSAWLSRPNLARMRDIHSPLQWVYCLLAYIAIRCQDQSVRNMLTYGRIILHLALKHGGSGWLEYDRTFRQQAAADPTIPWNILNPSLMASSVLSVSSAHSGTLCPHCQEVDHRGYDCALTSIDPFLDSPRHRTHPPSTFRHRLPRTGPLDSSGEICRRFNRGLCNDHNSCRFRHVCSVSECKKEGHGAFNCPLRAEKHKPPSTKGDS